MNIKVREDEITTPLDVAPVNFTITLSRGTCHTRSAYENFSRRNLSASRSPSKLREINVYETGWDVRA